MQSWLVFFVFGVPSRLLTVPAPVLDNPSASAGDVTEPPSPKALSLSLVEVKRGMIAARIFNEVRIHAGHNDHVLTMPAPEKGDLADVILSSQSPRGIPCQWRGMAQRVTLIKNSQS